MAQFPFVGPSYTARVTNLDAQRCINLYPEMAGPTSKSVAALIGTPGLLLFAALPVGPVRGLIQFNATTAFAVAGEKIYRVNVDGTFVVLPTSLLTAVGTVSMATNGTTVFLVTGLNGYVINPANNTFILLADPEFQGADRVDFIDGYYVFNRPGTGQFQITGLYSTDVDGLDFATAEGAPDLLVSLIVDHRELWLFGETSTEVFFNSGNSDFPFERINGAFIEQGCAAKFSVAKMDNSVFWLTADTRGQGMVMKSSGYSPQRISNHALEFAIASYRVVSDAVAYTYQQEGHSFYVLNFPTAKTTWVYDASSNMWHQRAWRDPVTNELQQHRAEFQMTFGGKTIVGDRQNGNLYQLSLDVFTDNGVPIARIRSCPHLSDPDYRYQMFGSLEIDMQTGVGLIQGQGAAPQAMLRWSTDGGYSWSNELWAPIGPLGARRTRVKWRRLGRSRDRVFEVTVTDPVRVAIVGASVQVITAAA